MKNAKTARSSEKKLTSQLEKRQAAIDTLEKANTQLSSQVAMLNERIDTLEKQCHMSSENAQHERFRAGKLENQLEDAQQESENWKQQALKVKKKVSSQAHGSSRLGRSWQFAAVPCIEEQGGRGEAHRWRCSPWSRTSSFQRRRSGYRRVMALLSVVIDSSEITVHIPRHTSIPHLGLTPMDRM